MILTTNRQQSMNRADPKKLNQITTSIVPETPKIMPEVKGADLSRMITTHDEPLPKGTEALCREIEDKPYAEAFAKKIDADFMRDAAGPKKAGRPRKAEGTRP